MSTNVKTSGRKTINGQNRADGLTRSQVLMIEEALAGVGDFGEVRLVVEKGRLRFVVTQKSVDALKWQPAERAVDPQDG